MKKWLALLALVGLASCDDSRSVLAPVNARADAIAGLGWVVVIGFTVVVIVMWILIAWAALRRRGTFDSHRLVSTQDGIGWVWVGGLVIPALAFGGLLAMSLARMHTASPEQHDAMGGMAMDGKAMGPDIVVTGHRWWWQVEYRGDDPSTSIASANEIRIPTGKVVTIELHSADVIHSFWVPNLEGKVDLIPGHVTHISFSADKAGRYEGQCGEYCGEEHARMRLVVIAMPPDEYTVWRAHEAGNPPPPTGDKERRGLAVFETKACALCHAVRGTRARATVGPDLTHFAERAELAANAYPNNRGYLGGWIVHAQSLKPAAEMPDLATLTGEELDALESYLEALR